MKLLIKNGHVIDPVNGLNNISNIWIEGSKIVGVGKKPNGFIKNREMDASGLVVCPGFVDIGTHLREPGLEQKGTIASEATAAAAAGFTTLCCTPNTTPVIDTPAVVELINQRARDVPVRIKCIGALTAGLQGKVLAEMHALKAIGCVGVSNGGNAIKDTAVFRNALEYAATLGLTVFLRPEDHWLAAEGLIHEGLISTKKGLTGIPASAELIDLAKSIILIEQTGARAHFQCLSVARSKHYLLQGRKRGLPITSDISISHASLCDEDILDFDTNFHVRPPLRSRSDRRSLVASVAKGDIDVITAHHEPHDRDSKATTFASSSPGISSLDTFLPLILSLVEKGEISLMKAIDSISIQPALAIGQKHNGISKGAVADLCCFDPKKEWLVTARTMKSLGKNSPFINQVMKGKVMSTIVAGKLVYSEKAHQ
jgi:dihydroorotase